ncbi:MAG: diacylglycerol kinase [Limimaricola sp.]|nr:diacylglycerol kinase [Limimaricola sp.]
MRRVWLRAKWSWQGVVHVWRTEGSLQQWLWANAVSLTAAFLLPLSSTERAMLLMGGVMILAAECMNTAIERVVDDISTERRDRAGQAKDAGSAAVALTGVAVGLVWVCVIWRLLS